MSKRSRCRAGHSNPTTEKNRRKVRNLRGRRRAALKKVAVVLSDVILETLGRESLTRQCMLVTPIE